MNKRTVFSVLGVLGVIAAAVMYFVGKESANLSELQQFWWIPAILGVIFLIIGGSKRRAA
jgi:hypothetical protein